MENDSVLLTKRPRVSVYSKTNPEIIEDNSIIEIDGGVNTTKEKIYKTFDHHRSGELINSDSLPQEIESLEGKEIATHMMDSDFIISSAIALAGGRGQIDEERLKIMESASRYCDLLEDEYETNEEIKNKGLALHLYLKNNGFKSVGDLARERGETKEIAPGKIIPNASDKTNSEVAEKLVYELLSAIVSNSENFDKMQDLTYLSKKDKMQEKWKEACIRNDEKFAIIETQEFIDSLFAYELVKGKIQVIANKQENGYKYTIGVKPNSYEDVDLTNLIKKLNEIDSNVINQEKKEGLKKEAWGGRNVVMGSPFRINSGLSVEEISDIIEKFLEK